jgi:hypothetical protein
MKDSGAAPVPPGGNAQAIHEWCLELEAEIAAAHEQIQRLAWAQRLGALRPPMFADSGGGTRLLSDSLSRKARNRMLNSALGLLEEARRTGDLPEDKFDSLRSEFSKAPLTLTRLRAVSDTRSLGQKTADAMRKIPATVPDGRPASPPTRARVSRARESHISRPTMAASASASSPPRSADSSPSSPGTDSPEEGEDGEPLAVHPELAGLVAPAPLRERVWRSSCTPRGGRSSRPRQTRNSSKTPEGRVAP